MHPLRFLLIAALLSTVCTAAEIDWQPAEVIGKESAPPQSGTVWCAYGFGQTGAVNVNGVEFTPAPVSGEGAVSVEKLTVEAASEVASEARLLSGVSGVERQERAPFYRQLEEGYQQLLARMVQAERGPVTITLTGLEPGRLYRVQFWSNRSEAKDGTHSFFIADDPALEVWVNAHGLTGGVGQTITGTFRADSSQQSFTLYPQQPAGPVINAILVHAL